MQELIARFNTKAQARFYLKHSGADFEDYEEEDEAYQRTLEKASSQLEVGLKMQFVDRRYISNFIFSDKDIVVAIGQDGLVANVAKYAAGQPIIGVNPDPRRFDGVLVPSKVENLRTALHAVASNKANLLPVTLAEVKLNDGQRLLAFNDLYIGAQTHISARYRLQYHNRSENQSSSGIIVSTGAGSTGWLSSVFNMASGINALVGNHGIAPIKMDWTCRDLLFVVREPFASRHSEAGIISGFLEEGECLEIESRMPASGTIFSDGIESDFLVFNSGSIAKIQTAKEIAMIYAPGETPRNSGLQAQHHQIPQFHLPHLHRS